MSDDGGDRRAIVIEDDADVAALISVNLRRRGWQVQVAHDGPTGVRMIREDRPDVVVLDLRMSPMDGFEVLRTLADDGISDDVPVVVVSIVEESERVKELGARAFVLKPFRPGTIPDTIDAVLADVEG